MEVYEIRAGTLNDLDEMEQLYDTLCDYLQGGTNYPGYRRGIYPIRANAEKAVKEGSLFILRIGSRIAGSVILDHDVHKAYEQGSWAVKAENSEVIVISVLVVHPDFMKQGIGMKLMEFAKLYALEQNAKAIRLDVAVQNGPAIALYEKCGYSYAGTVDLKTGYDHLIWFRLYELVLNSKELGISQA